MTTAEWDIYLVSEVREWIGGLDSASYARVVHALDLLAEAGPGPGRPLVDTIHGSALANLKELATVLGHRLHQAIYFDDDGDIAAIALRAPHRGLTTPDFPL